MKKIDSHIASAIIAHAKTVPTGDNCQPFSFSYDEQSIVVTYDRQLGKHRLNPGEHASAISLGALIELIAISASQFQLKPLFSIIPDDLGKTKCKWLEVYFEDQPGSPDPLVPAIPKRMTDRRPFKRGPIPTELFSTATYNPSLASFHFTPANNKQLINYISKTDFLFWHDRNIVFNTLGWIRFTNSEINKTQDGMSWRNLGINFIDALFFRLLKKIPLLLPLIKNCGGSLKSKLLIKKQLQSSSFIGCITVKSTSRAELIETGRMICRLWLQLNSHGYGFQPLALTSFSIYNMHTDHWFYQNDAAVNEHFKRGLELLKDVFKLEDNEIPLWLFRSGKQNELPLNMRTLRRS